MLHLGFNMETNINKKDITYQDAFNILVGIQVL